MAARRPLVRVGGKISQLPQGDTVEGAGGGAASVAIQASEALAAGDFVEIYSSSGAKCRKADAQTPREAKGYVLAAALQGADAQVFFLGGVNDKLSGLVPGEDYYLSLTPGGVSSVAPSGTGQALQSLGVAVSPTSLLTIPGMFIELE